MLCCFFRGPVLYKQKIIYHDKKTNKNNKYITISNTPGCPISLWAPSCCFECQSPGGSMTVLLEALSFQTLLLYKAAKKEKGGVTKWWARWTLCWLGLLSMLQKKNGLLKCSSGLQLSYHQPWLKQQYGI